jgi:parvulin-like peptidyl-prolyl isomerase
MSSLNSDLAKLLYYAPLGEAQPLQQFGHFYAIIRVEQRLSAQLDDQMRHRLLQQQFDRWFQDQLQQLPEADQRWMGIASASVKHPITGITNQFTNEFINEVEI